MEELTPQEKDISEAVKRSVKEAFGVTCQIILENEPEVKKEPTTQWMRRYSILRPRWTVYTSVITFRFGKKKSIYSADGIIVIFYPENTLNRIIKGMQVPVNSEDDLLDAAGEFCNIVAGNIKCKLVEIGYPELEISIPVNFAGSITELFEYHGTDKLRVIYKDDDDEYFAMVEIAVSISINE